MKKRTACKRRYSKRTSIKPKLSTLRQGQTTMRPERQTGTQIFPASYNNRNSTRRFRATLLSHLFSMSSATRASQWAGTWQKMLLVLVASERASKALAFYWTGLLASSLQQIENLKRKLFTWAYSLNT